MATTTRSGLDREGAGRDPPYGPAVRFDDAAVRVDGRLVWSNLTLRIQTGEFAAILGPNGVGKSTLVKAALGLTPLAAGSARVARAPARSVRG